MGVKGLPRRPRGPPAPARRTAAPTGVAGTALAVEVVDALHAVLGAAGVTGVGQTLVDVALTALAHEAGQAGAAVAAHLVHAGAIVEALGAPGHGVDEGAAVVHVHLAVHACRGRAPSGTREGHRPGPAPSRCPDRRAQKAGDRHRALPTAWPGFLRQPGTRIAAGSRVSLAGHRVPERPLCPHPPLGMAPLP